MIIGSVVSEELRRQDFGTDGVTALLELLSPLATQVKNLSVTTVTHFVCLFVCVEFNRPTREFFTHMETSQLPIKGCKF